MADARLPHASFDCLLRVETLDAGSAQVQAHGQAWCTEAESERARGFGAEHRRRQYLAGHWLARRLAAERFGGQAAQWQWQTTATGAPSLQHPALADAVSVSVSHSGDAIAAAVASRPIGLDLEFPRRPRPLRELAAFAFSPEENAALGVLPEAAYGEHFYALWSLKEAQGKRSGRGLLPGLARRITSRRCGLAEAEALLWPLPAQGSLALAAWPGCRIDVQGLAGDAQATPWRYVDATG